MEYSDMLINNCNNCIHRNVCMDYSDMERIIREFGVKSNAHNRSCGSVDDNIVVNWTMKCRSYKSETENIVPNTHLENYSQLNPVEIMAEANRIQTESIAKAYGARRGVGCPVPETNNFDIYCGENYPH